MDVDDDVTAMAERGQEHEDRGDLAGAVQWYRRAAGGGHVQATHNLAVLLEDAGEAAEAETWYERAADLGHGPAMHDYGLFLVARGEHERAAAMYRRAADAGQASSMCNLGVLLDDPDWFHRALAAGYARAGFYLGRDAHARGDVDGARRWLRVAAEGGDPESMYVLAKLSLYVGEHGEAAHWGLRAADAGHADARRDFVQI